MMPSQSKKQHNLMALVANNPSAAKRLKVPQSVGEDFMKADMGKKFKEGGASMTKGGMIATPMGKVTSGGKRPHGEHTVQAKGHTKGKMVKMSMGGKAC